MCSAYSTDAALNCVTITVWWWARRWSNWHRVCVFVLRQLVCVGVGRFCAIWALMARQWRPHVFHIFVVFRHMWDGVELSRSFLSSHMCECENEAVEQLPLCVEDSLCKALGMIVDHIIGSILICTRHIWIYYFYSRKKNEIYVMVGGAWINRFL